MNVLVTRPKQQAEDLCHLIEQQGWNAVRFPSIEIVAINNQLIQQQIQELGCYQWLIFISVNAVNFAISANNGKIEGLKKASIAAVGKATAKALIKSGLNVDLVPETLFSTEGLLATKAMQDVKGMSCLIVRGKGGLESLADNLRLRGANVDYMEVYKRNRPVATNFDRLGRMLQQGELDVITITSGQALKNLWEMVDESLHASLQNVPLIVISNRIKKLAETYQFKIIAVTNSPGDAAIIETAIIINGE